MAWPTEVSDTHFPPDSRSRIDQDIAPDDTSTAESTFRISQRSFLVDEMQISDRPAGNHEQSGHGELNSRDGPNPCPSPHTDPELLTRPLQAQ